MSLTTWTTEQMLSLAPDGLSARAAERVASPRQWGLLGKSGDGVWGEFQNPNMPPYHVLVTLPEVATSCDCKARKRPCRHVLALALLLAREPQQFVVDISPPWVSQRKLEADQDQQELEQIQTSSGAQEAAYEQLLETVKGGMRRLELWLKDIVHGGMAALPSRPVAQWNETASLLSDAQAPEVAADIRALRPIVGGRDGWPEEMLRRLGRLYLLTQAFAAYDSLSIESQADLRASSGWFADPRHRGQEHLNGRWLVLGSAHQFVGSSNLRRSWLYGVDRPRFAYIEQRLDGQNARPLLLSGTTLQGTLRFAPGAWPLRATIESRETISPASGTVKGYGSLRQARAAYGKALSMNPWLRRFPMVLRGVQAELDGGLWVLRDREGYILPLTRPFLYGWHLQVIHSMPDAALFGEWDGTYLWPLSVYHRGGWLALRVLRGQK